MRILRLLSVVSAKKEKEQDQDAFSEERNVGISARSLYLTILYS